MLKSDRNPSRHTVGELIFEALDELGVEVGVEVGVEAGADVLVGVLVRVTPSRFGVEPALLLLRLLPLLFKVLPWPMPLLSGLIIVN
jgi:hypothetical protein